MKKGIKNLTLKLIIFISIVMLFPKNALALTFKVDRSVDTVKPGGEVTVYIKAEDVPSDSLNSYNISLTYDSSKLEYKSSTSDTSTINAANPITITKGNNTISNDGTIATIVFGVKPNAKAGSTNLTLTSSDITKISGNEIDKDDVTNTSSMITIAALGSDATLSSLKIPNTTLSPKFDKNVTEYEANIKDITEVTINATATDSNAKIMISDNYKNLAKGENTIKISVTAENGTTTKSYTIKVNLSLTPTEEELLKANTKLKKLEIKDYDIDFSNDIKKYTLSVPYKTKKIKLNAEPENENAKVEIEGLTTLKVGKNIVKIIVTSEDLENTDTYTLTVTREKEEKKIVQTCPDETSSREWILFTVSMLVTFTLGIVLGYFSCKKEILKKLFKKKKKEEKAENITTLSDTIEIDTKKVNDETLKEKNKDKVKNNENNEDKK